jgi:hypothetical protein
MIKDTLTTSFFRSAKPIGWTNGSGRTGRRVNAGCPRGTEGDLMPTRSWRGQDAFLPLLWFSVVRGDDRYGEQSEKD